MLFNASNTNTCFLQHVFKVDSRDETYIIGR